MSEIWGPLQRCFGSFRAKTWIFLFLIIFGPLFYFLCSLEQPLFVDKYRASLKYHKEGDLQQVLEFQDERFLISRPSKFFVYSAFLDFVRDDALIRVIALAPNNFRFAVYCHLFHEDGRTLGVLEGKVVSTPKEEKLHSAAFIECGFNGTDLWEKLDKAGVSSLLRIRDLFTQDPYFVAILPIPTRDAIKSPSTILKIQVTPDLRSAKAESELVAEPKEVERQRQPPTFGVCSQAIYDYDMVSPFLQWLEFLKLMGVSHFTFYNTNAGPRLSCVLKSKALNEESIIRVLPWRRVMENKEIHHYGQIATIMDCNFRYRGEVKHMVHLDLDEMIVPRKGENYAQLLDNIIKASSPDPANVTTVQFVFHNAFFLLPAKFYFGAKIDQKQELELDDILLHKYRYRAAFCKLFERSKYITTPRLLLDPCVHVHTMLMLGPVPGLRLRNISPSFGYLHHLRAKDSVSSCVNATEQLEEDAYAARKWGSLLLSRVNRMLRKVKAECPLTTTS